MSQLNLQQILSGDDLSVVVDKLNYNFNQILLNGGGPQGLQGIIGAPGLPGAQGNQGVTGPSGEEGTHIYVSGATPGIYPFGTGGEILPRIGDVYVETDPTFLNIYQLSVTGGTGSYWNLVDTITPPGNSLSKLVVDQVLGASATWTNTANDPTISGKFLYGSPDALYSSYIIDPAFPITSANPTLRAEMSSVALYGDSLVTFASGKNQLRLIDYTRADATRLQDGGGIAHSVETASGSQYYRIVNADLQGFNRFYLSLNGGLSVPSLIYGDTSNRIGFGVADATPLVASTTINGSIAVGRLSTSFYLASAGATLSGGIGAVIEGNVAIGRNNNGNYTLGVYNRPSQFGSSLLLDTSIGNTTGAVSSLTLGGGVYDLANGISSIPNNLWRFTANYDSTVTNVANRTLRLSTTQYFDSAYQNRDAMTFGLTGALGVTATQISVDSTSLYGKFEVGDQNHNKVSIGNTQGVLSTGFMNAHIGFNLSRSPVSSNWRRGGDGTSNAGKTIWSSNSRGLGFSFFGSTGGATATSTDTGVFASTKIYMSLTGAIATSDYTNASLLETLGYSLHIDSAAAGTTGQGATSSGVFRRFVATFGDGAQSSKNGSPLIASTNGILQSTSSGISIATGVTAQVVPHYTWHADDLYGLYLSQGTFVNGAAGRSVGIAVGGSAGITLTGMFNTDRRLGVDQENPLSKMHIGAKFTYNENNVFVSPGPAGVGSVTTNFIGYNTYYNLGASQIRRIAGSTATGATQQGAFDLRFIENDITDPFVPAAIQGLTGYSSMGTKLALVPHGPGGIFTNLTDPSSSTSYRGMIISPPATGPTAGGWINYSANTPRVSIGLNDSTILSERDSQFSLRRGTLSIAAQTRIKPATSALPASGPFGLTIEDQYNIGLYSYDSLPVAGVFGAGGNSSTTLKSFGINFLGTGGNVIADDISLLFATTSKGLTQTFSRIANFGSGFRLGVNIVPANQPTVYTVNTDPIYDFASLVVGAYTEGLTGSALRIPTAVISKGALVVDQSTYGEGDGANQGIYFKDNSINWSGASTRPNVNSYVGDWGIQYWKAGATESGLNFWKPFGSTLGSFSGNNALYLSDNGFVGVRTTIRRQLGATMSVFNVGGSAYIDGSVGIGTTQLTYSSSPAITGGIHSPGVNIWTSFSGPNEVKLAVNGGIKSNYIINISDRRVKDNISPLICDSETFMKLNPVSFTMKDNSGIHFGFIAQDVQETHPEIIRIFEDEELEGGRMAIDYNSMIAILTAQVQGQQKVIEDKDKKIDDLENRIKIIEEKLGL
jgi:hypothetical protein